MHGMPMAVGPSSAMKHVSWRDFTIFIKTVFSDFNSVFLLANYFWSSIAKPQFDLSDPGLWVEYLGICRCLFVMCEHRLFTNGWETRSRDVWKPVSNRTPGIISKICKLGGGTPAPVCSGLLRPYKISHGLL